MSKYNKLLVGDLLAAKKLLRKGDSVKSVATAYRADPEVIQGLKDDIDNGVTAITVGL